jgi:hypothetical protein
MPAKGFHGAHTDLQECLLAVVGDALCWRRKMARGDLPGAVASIVRLLRPTWPHSEEQARVHKLCQVIDFRLMKVKGPGAVSEGGIGGAAEMVTGAGQATTAVDGSRAATAASRAPSLPATLAQTIAPASIFADATRAVLFPASQRDEIALQALSYLDSLPVASSGYAAFKGILVCKDGVLHSWAAQFIYDFFDYVAWMSNHFAYASDRQMDAAYYMTGRAFGPSAAAAPTAGVADSVNACSPGLALYAVLLHEHQHIGGHALAAHEASSIHDVRAVLCPRPTVPLLEAFAQFAGEFYDRVACLVRARALVLLRLPGAAEIDVIVSRWTELQGADVAYYAGVQVNRVAQLLAARLGLSFKRLRKSKRRARRALPPLASAPAALGEAPSAAVACTIPVPLASSAPATTSTGASAAAVIAVAGPVAPQSTAGGLNIYAGTRLSKESLSECAQRCAEEWSTVDAQISEAAAAVLVWLRGMAQPTPAPADFITAKLTRGGLLYATPACIAFHGVVMACCDSAARIEGLRLLGETFVEMLASALFAHPPVRAKWAVAVKGVKLPWVSMSADDVQSWHAALDACLMAWLVKTAKGITNLAVNGQVAASILRARALEQAAKAAKHPAEAARARSLGVKQTEPLRAQLANYTSAGATTFTVAQPGQSIVPQALRVMAGLDTATPSPAPHSSAGAAGGFGSAQLNGVAAVAADWIATGGDAEPGGLFDADHSMVEYAGDVSAMFMPDDAAGPREDSGATGAAAAVAGGTGAALAGAGAREKREREQSMLDSNLEDSNSRLLPPTHKRANADASVCDADGALYDGGAHTDSEQLLAGLDDEI